MFFLSFTPFSFLFLLNYILVLVITFNCNNLVIFWLLIEVINFFYISLAYSIKLKSIRSLILFFLIQVFFSFGILFMSLLKYRFLLTLFLMIKLALFPFMSWFIQTTIFFPSVLVLIRFTCNKIPIFLMIFKFSLKLQWRVLSLSILISMLFSRVIIFYRTSPISLLIYSSIGGNTWLIIRIEVSYYYFIIFIVVYFYSLAGFIKIFIRSTHNFFIANNTLFYFVNLASLPPFPLFWLKVFIIIFLIVSNVYFSILCLILIVSVFIRIGYIQFFLKSILYSQSWV